MNKISNQINPNKITYNIVLKNYSYLQPYKLGRLKLYVKTRVELIINNNSTKNGG